MMYERLPEQARLHQRSTSGLELKKATVVIGVVVFNVSLTKLHVFFPSVLRVDLFT